MTIFSEPWLLDTLLAAQTRARCGFVGSAVIGLGFEGEVRPHEQQIEFWEGPVAPERVEPEGPLWPRHRLHNAANLLHVQRAEDARPDRWRLYKVAWVGGCVLYHRAKLEESGAFNFWSDLGPVHVGEDVQAQRQVMARFGGAGLFLSGAYHQELPITLPDRTCDAPRLLTI